MFFTDYREIAPVFSYQGVTQVIPMTSVLSQLPQVFVADSIEPVAVVHLKTAGGTNVQNGFGNLPVGDALRVENNGGGRDTTVALGTR